LSGFSFAGNSKKNCKNWGLEGKKIQLRALYVFTLGPMTQVKLIHMKKLRVTTMVSYGTKAE
jgi:hypothetical protein